MTYNNNRSDNFSRSDNINSYDCINRSDRYINLVLCDPIDPSNEMSLRFSVFDTAIAQKWADLVAFLDDRRAHIKTPERFYNFDGDIKASDGWITQEINNCIQGINRTHPNYVNITNFGDCGGLSQRSMNELHEYFVDGALELESQAVLNTQNVVKRMSELKHLIRDYDYWDKFKLQFFSYANGEPDALSILDIVCVLEDHPQFSQVLDNLVLAFGPAQPFLERLNQVIHRWEDLCAVKEQLQLGEQTWKYFVMVYSPACGIPLEDDDYQYYSIRDVFGRVYLDDILPGKCLWDIFRDRDDQAAGDHYKNITHYWGDARFYFGPTHSEALTRQRLNEFWQWFEQNRESLNKLGFYSDDPHLTVGRLPVADLVALDGEDINSIDMEQINRRISQHQFIKRVILVDENNSILSSEIFGKKKWINIITDNLNEVGKLFF